MKVDLHIHSYYSDGTMSPLSIINEAKTKGLGKIAITDHNEIKGMLEALTLDKDYVLPGVELDSLYEGINVHILAYNFDLHNENFLRIIKETRDMLEKVDDELIYKIFAANKDLVNLDDYAKFEYDRTKGGWKAYQYLKKLGLISSVEGCFSLMKKYNHSHASVPFYSVKEIIEAIHEANGIAILAHPGKTFPKDKMFNYLDKMKEFKIDGIECFYPKHTYEEQMSFREYAIKNNLLITCGCDCHGSFQSTKIGEVIVESEYLNLNGLI